MRPSWFRQAGTVIGVVTLSLLISSCGGGPESSTPSMEVTGAEASTDLSRTSEKSAKPKTLEPWRRSDEDPPAKPNRQIQSGTLTAGSFDDVEHFEEFRQFLLLAVQHDPKESLPRLALGERVIVQINNEDGEPIGDARVVVRMNSSDQNDPRAQNPQGTALLDSTTGSDGRLMFLPGIDGAGNAREFFVTVYPPDGGMPVSQVKKLDQKPWQIKLPQTVARLPKRLDLALVIDTTGSMGDELEYINAEIDGITASVHRMYPDVDQRYALIVYRDQGDQYVTRTFDFTRSLEDFRSTLGAQHAAGGGDYPEAMHLALEEADKLSWRDRDTARVMFLVGDAPPHDEHLQRTLDVVRALRSKSVCIFPVAASGADLKCEFVMRGAAFLTLGQYLFLTDHSGVGNPHAEPHVPAYEVERLDRLMFRMIASELAGRKLAAREIIAFEGKQTQRPRHPQVPPPQHSAVPRYSLKSQAAFWPPRWVLLAIAIFCWFVIDAAIERSRLTKRKLALSSLDGTLRTEEQILDNLGQLS